MALVLIIDDSPTEVHVIRRALEQHGFQTATAGDGAEGIRLAKQMKPDLIFMDIVMPGVNGYQATRTLSQDPDTSGIPVIMVTSKSQPTDRVWACARAPSTTWSNPCPPRLSSKRRRPRSRAESR